MEYFIKPKSRFMFPHLKNGKLVTAFTPETKLQLISADDIGRFAQAAFTNPQKFHGLSIDLAAEALTMSEIANQMNATLGTAISAEFLSYTEAVASGLAPGWVQTQQWVNVTGGYKADIDVAHSIGVELIRFHYWLNEHKNSF